MDITKREAQLCEALRGVPQNLTVDFIRYEIPPSLSLSGQKKKSRARSKRSLQDAQCRSATFAC